MRFIHAVSGIVNRGCHAVQGLLIEVPIGWTTLGKSCPSLRIPVIVLTLRTVLAKAQQPRAVASRMHSIVSAALNLANTMVPMYAIATFLDQSIVLLGLLMCADTEHSILVIDPRFREDDTKDCEESYTLLTRGCLCTPTDEA